MDQFGLLLDGFAGALSPSNLMWVVIGCLIGTAVGVLPGLGSSMAVALLLPMTFALNPTAAFILFSGVYFGGLFGDSTMAILMNTPGQASSIASTFEGHQMAKNGKAPQALAIAAIGAFIGGMIASILVVFLAPFMADLSTKFGPAEYFALSLLAFGAISSVVSESVIKGLASLVMGLMFATVGIDQISGTERFTFGSANLFDGISLVIVAVGMLALGEIIIVASRIRRDPAPKALGAKAGRAWLSKAEFKEALPAWGRGTAIGLPFGVIPVGGSEVPTFLAYDVERRLDRRRKFPMFGKGAPRGLAAPEAAGNSTTGMAMGALLSLGLPVSATAAIMLAAFRQYGLQPGPLLFDNSPDLVWALLASFFIAMVVLLIINLPFAQLWAKLLLIPAPYLYGSIVVFCGLGIYATSPTMFDLLLFLAIGLLAFVFKRYDIPIAPLLIGMVLGPLAETSLRDALLSSDGDYSVFVSSPISITLYALLLAVLLIKARQVVTARTGKDV
ncbi:tripartite tricarboxylate transporter permease [Tsukamurella tyrosinosolvens]|uniref:Putative tricarboxylic transport membrane protein n=1 Tax=Tsukamurella tyrosinosolvens TaxID=57704 RepID=A0A1H4RCG3_TSUTY|nr:tripartite tricarboxylate transporter permease [Tsukamurella tyrosinosolvens]KXO93727.1 tripartite tricarboxylate transporter TctA [Tsukamurella tyrosinosolvens]QRY82791.1 tripartite tricarboxylate transporter permease [Tsukamurella tyrosinosolvens]RDB46882.1 tripartite tricarboxylate transporter permease [Tsukamurella tyrosinosolvens]SEC29498.1 putative tricarboxylic transport membrane protein [Tsukamurella tyrosinosolvens]